MAAPALAPIGQELHIENDVQLQLVLSIFLLTYAIGPFVLSPCSEVWGRSWIVRIGNLIFILFTALCGFATSKEQIIAFRFFAGIGGSVTIGMGSGVLADCWKPEERGKGIAFMQFAPILGLALGPIAGGYISQYTSWRWAFRSVAILNVCVQLVAFLFLRETYGPRLLLLKARKIRKETGNPDFQTKWEKEQRSLSKILRISLVRPWAMLATQPIIQSLAALQAFNFGMLYLIISSFPQLWEEHYSFEKGLASLNYISIATGSLIGVLICAPAMDAVYQRLKHRYGIEEGQSGLPEFRIPLMIPFSLLSPFGILLFAWSAQMKMHFLIPNIGIAITIGSSMVSYQCVSAYIADSYPLHSASASAACSFVRSMCAFAFPLFVPALFGNLGYGIGGSVLAVIAVVVGIPAPILLWLYGAKLRAMSRFGS
ncbi:major facilitator superfamily transporter [Colletotrichum truncatum]|uniref:Major facilitator superfamily transporter n=1 Tax=Colletotrichum truncatum TaxID=5467 RepID=A0ACC3YXZ3_COLTU|nr:major facilitator superfamily transporter [Colletotrichum truncatum]KAF6790844.1 major facilitator superfamily transporter [Colletotrichum truncatum]